MNTRKNESSEPVIAEFIGYEREAEKRERLLQKKIEQGIVWLEQNAPDGWETLLRNISGHENVLDVSFLKPGAEVVSEFGIDPIMFGFQAERAQDLPLLHYLWRQNLT